MDTRGDSDDRHSSRLVYGLFWSSGVVTDLTSKAGTTSEDGPQKRRVDPVGGRSRQERGRTFEKDWVSEVEPVTSTEEEDSVRVRVEVSPPQ